MPSGARISHPSFGSLFLMEKRPLEPGYLCLHILAAVWSHRYYDPCPVLSLQG